MKDEKNKYYFSYSKRVILFFSCFVVSFGLSIVMLLASLTFNKQQTLDYNEQSNIDYRVNLKENDFYESEYLGKDMAYIASLIDSVDIDFLYIFTSTYELDMSFDYDIVGKLVIDSQFEDKPYYEKEYVLLKNKKARIDKKREYVLKEKINIDYDKYNEIANTFKSLYGVNSDSSFKIYLKVHKSSSDKDINIDDTKNTYITIPLSQKAVEITMDKQDIKATKSIIAEESTIVDNVILAVLSVVFCITSIVFMIKLLRLLTVLRVKKSNYDKYIAKLLKEYDRLVVETTSKVKFNDKDVIKISKFNELLDVRDNLGLPIIYEEIVKHRKCIFYIKHNNDVYLLTIKAVDLEDEKC